MQDILAFQATLFICVTTGFVASLWLLLRYLALRQKRPLSSPTDAILQRLDRMEASIEALAIETERIGESNRFVARLLAERSVPKAIPGTPERVITPH